MGMHNYNASTNKKTNARILSFSIHPSGRLMLSIDVEHELKIWDLIRAKCMVTIKMPKPALDVCWSPNGWTYCIVRSNKLLIYSKEGALYKVIKPVCRLIDEQFIDRYQATIVCFCYVTHDMVAMADMSARIVVFDIDSKTALFRLSGHEQQQIQDENERTSNSQAIIRNLRACSLNGNLYLIAADNRGKICIWNVHDCLNRLIEINSGGMEAQTEEEEEEDDYSVDEHGLFTFAALMEVDTDTHITCMDCGVVGRLNHMYKWKKPRVAYGVSTSIQNPLGHEAEGEDEAETVISGKKRTFDEMEQNPMKNVVDSDDEEFEKMNNAKRRKKKKRKKKKKPKIDLSRFD